MTDSFLSGDGGRLFHSSDEAVGSANILSSGGRTVNNTKHKRRTAVTPYKRAENDFVLQDKADLYAIKNAMIVLRIKVPISKIKMSFLKINV